MSVQKDLNGDPLPEHIRGRDHLTMVQPPNPSSLSADPDRSECWCLICANRITVGSGEWGHGPACEHHERFDADAEPSSTQFVADSDQTEIARTGGGVQEADDE